MKTISGFCICLAFALMGCQEAKEAVQSKYRVDFDVTTAEPMNLSAFVDSIFVIPLETNDSVLIKQIRDVKLIDGLFYLNDDLAKVWVFDEKGKFLRSTERQLGEGPQQYRFCPDFAVSDNGNWFIADMMQRKLYEYDGNMAYVADYPLFDEVYRTSRFLRLSEDTYLFYNSEELKFYSLKQDSVLKRIVSPCVGDVPNVARTWLKEMDGGLYYSNGRPEHTLYRLDVEAMELEPFCTFAFEGHDFDWDDVPADQSVTFYHGYLRDHLEKAFVGDKYLLPHGKACFFMYDGKLHFAYHNEAEDRKMVFYNEPRTTGQLMIPDLCVGDKFYYACPPEYLEYAIDERLMSPESLQALEGVIEDDNPVLLVYRLK